MAIKYSLDWWGLKPTRAHETDAGIDLLCPEPHCLGAGDAIVINTGVHVEIPHGCAGFLKSKSGLNVKHGIISDGVIDEGYTGAIVVKLYNLGDDPYFFKTGDKLTQLVIQPVVCDELEEVEEISGGERGDSGFGSTGR